MGIQLIPSSPGWGGKQACVPAPLWLDYRTPAVLTPVAHYRAYLWKAGECKVQDSAVSHTAE